MKKLQLLTLLLSIAITTHAQDFTGNWQGSLNVGKTIRIVFHISKSDGKLTATMDSPDQGANGIGCDNIIVKGDSISIDVPAIKGNYVAQLKAETLQGALKQGGMQLPLTMKRSSEVIAVANNRPQTPMAPFSYISEDVVYGNEDATMQYGATITIPKGKGPFPALLLITGSGQQNRDEEIMGHKPFAVVADYLTKAGYIVLRVDDRGMGKTNGDIANATTKDFVRDAMNSLQYLKNRPEVNKAKIGLYGHSEGGLIAELIAAQDKSINFAILMAAPGMPISELLIAQNEAILKQNGQVNEAARNAYLQLYRNILVAGTEPNEYSMRQSIAKVVRQWRASTDSNIILRTTGINNKAAEEEFVEAFVTSLNTPWMKEFVTYNPKEQIEKMTCKVLALNGSKDVQVVSKPNLDGIRAALKKAGTRSYEVKELNGLNHLFQSCSKCTVNEYGELQETIAPAALQTVKDWLDKEVK